MQLQRQRPFGGGVEDERRSGSGSQGLARHIPFPHDAAHPRVRVVHVRGGVPLRIEHRVPIEHVIRFAVLGQVGVFDGPQSDHFRDALLRGVIERFVDLSFALAFVDLGPRPFDRLVEQRLQPTVSPERVL